MILPKERDPRLVTIRRGGTLTDADHQLHALWAADCAEHVLPLFEGERPSDTRPRDAIEAVRAWARGELRMMASRAAGGHAMGAARDLAGAARHAAYAAGQAACVPHVAEHNLGAAAYAIKAASAAAAPGGERGCCTRRRGDGRPPRVHVAATTAPSVDPRPRPRGPGAPQPDLLVGLRPRRPLIPPGRP